jgi:hypothetical protein
LIDEFRTLERVLEQAGYRVIVCIDEMDKLEPGETTEKFLNTVKQLFAIRSCSFLVSVSTGAWSRFVRRGVDVRDALDSSLDAIETAEPLDYLESRSLILHRREHMAKEHDAERISDAQIALCYTLSGGLPRELLRVARTMARINRDQRGAQKLDAVTHLMAAHQFEELIDGFYRDMSGVEVGTRDHLAKELESLQEEWQTGAPRLELSSTLQGDDSWPDAYVTEERLLQLRARALHLREVERLFCNSSPWTDINASLQSVDFLAALSRRLETNPTAARRCLGELVDRSR